MTARMLLKILWIACALGFAVPAHASRNVTAVTLTYGNQTNVTAITAPPLAALTATVTVAHAPGGGGGARWRATSWQIGVAPATCVNHVNFDASGTDTVTFNITAPVAVGTYNVRVIPYADDACTNNPGPVFTLAGGVTVSTADTSSVVANPTSVPADGTSTSLITVTLLDSGGAPRAGKTVLLNALAGSSAISPASGPSTAAGVVTFTVRDAVAETVVYRATNVSDAIVIAQTASVTFTAVATVASFNVVEPGADPVAGSIFTKIAGQNLALQIVALNAANAVAATFTGTVSVEVVDNASGGACDGLPTIATLTNQTFTAGDAGRHNLTAPNAVTDAYRNARIRVRYPAAAPTITRCSGDNFAIRPANLTIAASDATPATPGNANLLTNTAVPGGTVHKAGRPFTIAATAYNGAGAPAVTANYNGTPTATLAVCAGAACTPTTGTLTIVTWSAAGGTVTSNDASYDDVGAFRLELADDTFAAVDAADGTPAAQRTIPSTPIAVGRFVPDRFELSATSILPRADVPACAASSFTYLGERMDVAFTLTAVRYPAGTTTRYEGALAQLPVSATPVPGALNFGAIDTAAPTPLTPRVDLALGSTGNWAAGVATVSARVAIRRAATADGPFTSVRLGIAPTDADGVALDAVALNLDADASGTAERAQVGVPTALRFGRLRLQNAHGSQLIAMPLLMEAQYWNGTAFVRNTADSCTPILAGNVALGGYQKNLAAGETSVSVVSPITSGVGTLRLTAPGANNNGAVDVSINLTGGGAGVSCTAGMPASTGSGLSYLHGAWCGATFNRDPTARATFGVFRASRAVVYQRENF